MAIKELNTRIALKYDSYENWKNSELVLLPGEVGICTIPAAPADGSEHATNNPTVLFKVGDGSTPYKELKWASALAADVYSWAKASDVVYNRDAKTITFVGGIKNTDGTVSDKVFTLNYVTAEEVNTLISGTVQSVSDHENRLDKIEGTGVGSIAKAAADTLASAQAYADQAEADAISTANTHTNTEIAKDRERLTAIETKNNGQDTSIAANTKAIGDEAAARAAAISGVENAYKAADKEITDKIGAVTGTVAEAIEAAKNAAISAAEGKVTALANGQVNTNKTDIATNTQNIATLRADLSTETSDRKAADEDLDERLAKVETFFNAAGESEGYDGLNKALDTLVEIQTYLTGDGEAAGDLIGRIAANEEAIEDLEAEFTSGRVVTIEQDLAEVKGKAATLMDIVDGYSDKSAIKNAVDAVKATAEQGVADAATAQSAAEKAQDDVDALAAIVNAEGTGLAAIKDIADENTKNIAANGEAIEGLVQILKGYDSEGAVAAAVQNAYDLANEAKGDFTRLNGAFTELRNAVEHEETGLAATKAIADAAASQAEDNAKDIADIKADYLKAADEYVFNCGSATKVVHVLPSTQE